ncbi:MAG: Rid family detoxifying hydrolase, partial [Bacteroidia bacterium]|nr:Rid family detoxifying hydrolase [Bacteroidia bacterium]
RAPAPVGPYNQAIRVGQFLFVSGQIAINPESGDLVTDNIDLETIQVMKNIGAILNEAGMDYKNIVKASVFVTDMHLYGRINGVYEQYFEDMIAPARELVEVSNLPKFVNVEISVIAAEL